ncbi:hypothetical protein [Phormidium nigroviride]
MSKIQAGFWVAQKYKRLSQVSGSFCKGENLIASQPHHQRPQPQVRPLSLSR